MNSLQKTMKRINEKVDEAKKALDVFYTGSQLEAGRVKGIYRPDVSRPTGPDGSDPVYTVYGNQSKRIF